MIERKDVRGCNHDEFVFLGHAWGTPMSARVFMDLETCNPKGRTPTRGPHGMLAKVNDYLADPDNPTLPDYELQMSGRWPEHVR